MRGTMVPSVFDVESIHNRSDRKALQVFRPTWQSSCTFEDVMAHSYNFTPRDRDRADSRVELFKSLEFKESRQRSVLMSIVVHGVMLCLLLAIPLIFTDALKIRFST